MRRVLSLVVFVVSLGCKPELPSLDYRGERVRVGSGMVEQVCEGTLIRIDREVEQIEARLDLPRQESWLDVYVVDRNTVDAYCGGAPNCAFRSRQGAPSVVVDHEKFERAIAHELVHARLAHSPSAPLFTEGVAEAASLPSCPRSVPDVGLSEILAAKDNAGFRAIRDSYYIGEELAAWLLEQFGPGEVLHFLQSVDRGSSSAAIQARYIEHFDRELEADFLAHFRTRADLDTLPPEHFGCLSPPIGSSTGPAKLVANLDCDSDRVHNNFGIDGSGYVEWTLHLDHEQTLKLVGVVPVGTSLTIEECGCISRKDEDEYLLARPFDPHETLQPGSYRLRWSGALDEGLSLDVELVPL
jgi:hypothetical protein